MIRRNIRTLALLMAIAVMLACAPTLGPAVPPTLDPLSINTSIAQTAAAAGTQTAVFAPPTLTFTPTAVATRTPTEVPSPTPTFIFILPTATVPTRTPSPRPSGSQYDCRVDSQSPANDSVFGVNADFDATWRVTNIGTSNWNGNSTDYLYTGGDKIHQQGIYDLSRSVPVSGQIDIGVDMRAPNATGTYTTTWHLRIGNTQFCPMTLRIVVQ